MRKVTAQCFLRWSVWLLLAPAFGFLQRSLLHRCITRPHAPSRPAATLVRPANRIYHGTTKNFAAPLDRSYLNSDEQFELTLDDFDLILEGVKIFQNVYGNCNIPSRFDVPAQPPWPLALHGLRLGRRLEKLQTSHDFMNKHPDKVQQLADIGWDPNNMNLVEDWDNVLTCLKLYKAQHGDLRIPSKFIVPSEAPWPRTAWGLKIGVRVAAIRSAGRYVKENPNRKAVLDSLGFEWKVRDTAAHGNVEEARFATILRALEHYKRLEEPNFTMINKYVVPDSAEWPAELRGMKLGYEVRAEMFLYVHRVLCTVRVLCCRDASFYCVLLPVCTC
jgi:hypothetical protein